MRTVHYPWFMDGAMNVTVEKWDYFVTSLDVRDRLSIARQMLTNKEGMYIVMRMVAYQPNHAAERVNWLFEKLASRGTLEDMFACILIHETIVEEDYPNFRTQSSQEAHPRDARDLDHMGDFFSWLWSAILERGGPRSTEEIFLFLRSFHRVESADTCEHGDALYAQCLNLLTEGEQGRAEFRVSAVEIVALRAYFEKYGLRRGDEKTLAFIGQLLLGRNVAATTSLSTT